MMCMMWGEEKKGKDFGSDDRIKRVLVAGVPVVYVYLVPSIVEYIQYVCIVVADQHAAKEHYVPHRDTYAVDFISQCHNVS